MTVGTSYTVDYTNYDNTTSQVSVEVEECKSAFEEISDDVIGDFFSSSEKCTDGSDDGEISLGCKIGSAAKGAVNTALNALKSCVTDSEGNFSIGKTVGTIAMGAACVAFPALGVAACAVGAVSGAVQIGKGITAAMNAETDAEAKQAWQNIGGGALTTGVSVAGAKASYASMKSTSSAGALEALDDSASTAQKVAAFAKDAASSTKNQTTKIVSNTTQSIKNAATKTGANSAANGSTGAASGTGTGSSGTSTGASTSSSTGSTKTSVFSTIKNIVTAPFKAVKAVAETTAAAVKIAPKAAKLTSEAIIINEVNNFLDGESVINECL